MNIQNPPDAQDYYLDGLTKITSEILKQTSNGYYLYRGEPQAYEEEPHFGKVSSTLYRIAPESFDSGEHELGRVQEHTVCHVRNCLPSYAQLKDFEILTELQHYGAETNLIDFTRDFRIALFFACNGSHAKDGRIILLKRSVESTEKYQIQTPKHPPNRVLAQKSTFAQPPNGYIDPQDIHVIAVPRNLKQWILIHLYRIEDIAFHSIFNDIFGYIRFRASYTKKEAVEPHLRANRAVERARATSSAKEKKELLENATADYATSVPYTPYDAEIYLEQGQCFVERQERELAIEAFTKATFLRTDYADAYFRRAMLWMLRSKWENAKSDLLAAKTNGTDVSTEFCSHYTSVKDFERDYRVTVPDDITAILQPQ